VVNASQFHGSWFRGRQNHAARRAFDKSLTHVSSLLTSAGDPKLQEQGPFGALDKGKSSKIDAKMHKRIFARLDRLDVAVRPEEMSVPGFDFHSLHGFDPKGYSVHINGPWCITFEFEDGEACRVDFEQYH
jgi:proteic killer suppression protein